MALLYMFFIYVLYFTEVGVYHRDVKGYSAAMEMYAENHNMAKDDAIRLYSEKIMKSNRYGDFVKAIGIERVKQDLS